MNHSMQPPSPREPSEVSKLFGAVLITVGVLIATLCGLCSLAVGGSMLAASLQQLSHGGQTGLALGGPLQVLFMVGLFGGVPFLIGVALVLAGLEMRRGQGSR